MSTYFSGRKADRLSALCILYEKGLQMEYCYGHIESHATYCDFVGDNGMVEHFDFTELVPAGELTWSARRYPVEKERYLLLKITDSRYLIR